MAACVCDAAAKKSTHSKIEVPNPQKDYRQTDQQQDLRIARINHQTTMRIISILFLCSVLYTSAAGRHLQGATDATTPSTSSAGACAAGNGAISVSGVGKAAATPDMATINAGVTTKAISAQDALAANNDAMAKIMEVLFTTYQIEEKDVQTNGFNLSPEYEYPRDGTPRILTGYSVSNRLNVKVMNLDNLGSILDALVNAGSNDMSGIQFGFSDTSTLQDEARENAVLDAQQRATLYATAAGVELGDILSISEPGAPTIRHAKQEGFAMDMAASSSGGFAVPVSVGENEISATIHMVYALTTPSTSE